jgi:hypothetical protein
LDLCYQLLFSQPGVSRAIAGTAERLLGEEAVTAENKEEKEILLRFRIP